MCDNVDTERIPHPCNECDKGKGTSCTKYTGCSKWMRWFEQEWEIIRASSEEIKKEGESNENSSKRKNRR